MTAPAGSAVDQVVSAAAERMLEGYSWLSFALGPPPAREHWFPLHEFTSPGAVDALITLFEGREAEDEGETPRTILGNYVFRYLLNAPLRLAGYLFIAERRVPMLTGHTWLRNHERLQHGRLDEARLLVTPDDPLASEAGVEVVPEGRLADALFEQVERAYGSVLAAFRDRRYVAVSNGWGSILDALAQGMLAAGKAEVGIGEAWRRWEAATAGREFPVRRRPLRFSLDIDGLRDELAVRAGCCLWYATPSGRASEHRYCASCYLMSDEQRAQIRRNAVLRAAASES